MNVLYMLKAYKNLVSSFLLNKHGFWMVFESGKVISSRSGMYVAKCYVLDGLFKLNVITFINKNINNYSTYLLGHVNFNYLCD